MSSLNDDQPRSSVGEKIAGKLPEKKRQFSKGDARYWLVPGRLFKDHNSADFSCRFSLRGKRNQVCLNTSNQRKAASLAAELFNSVARNGWEPALVNYRPEPKLPPPVKPTVGNLIQAFSRISTARSQSTEAYTKAFRLIVSEIKSISPERKHDSGSRGSAEWRAKIDAVELETLIPSDVLAWKNRRLKEVDGDPLKKKRAIVTVNSLIRNSKALFAKKILPFIEESMPIPRPLPFDGVTMEKAPSMRYISKIDPYAILASAKAELAENDLDSFKVIVLALVCGLRKSEIDHLLWSALDISGSKWRIESSEYHELKSEDSAGTIDLDEDTLNFFKSCRAAEPRAVFVIANAVPAAPTKVGRSYRCHAVFKRALSWLRNHGAETTKPLHTLRKEVGSIIASEHGIFEASRYLRHSDIRITSSIYADKKKIVTPKTFAGLLKPKLEDNSNKDFDD
jgi:integrase